MPSVPEGASAWSRAPSWRRVRAATGPQTPDLVGVRGEWTLSGPRPASRRASAQLSGSRSAGRMHTSRVCLPTWAERLPPGNPFPRARAGRHEGSQVLAQLSMGT